MADIDPKVKHDLFTEYESEWILNADIAEMRLATLRGGEYLERFGDGTAKGENEAQYGLRKKMLLQSDMASALVEMRVSELWRKNPDRKFKDSPQAALIEEFINNVDDAGTSMDTFMKRVTELMMINGVDVLVDTNATTVAPNSLADEDNRPFLSEFSPLKRFDWSVDHAGRYKWVRFFLGEDSSLHEDGTGAGGERYVTYTPDIVRVYSVTGTGKDEEINVTEMPHNMGIVPVVQVYWGRSIHDDQKAIATSLMSQLSPIARYMLNLMSQGQLDLYMTVAFFVAIGVTAAEVGEALSASCIKAFSDPAASFSPVFTDVKHITEKREWLDYLSLQMLRIGKILGLNATLEGRASSGVQVAVEASPLHSELSATACTLETSEIEIMRLLVSRKIGSPVSTEELGYSVDYNKTFTLQSTKSLIEEAAALSKVVGVSEVPQLMQVLLRKILSASAREGSPEHDAALEEINNFIGDSVDMTITETGEGNDTEGSAESV